jgi:hypothetical protein
MVPRVLQFRFPLYLYSASLPSYALFIFVALVSCFLRRRYQITAQVD